MAGNDPLGAMPVADIARAQGFPLAGAVTPAYVPPKAPLNPELVQQPRVARTDIPAPPGRVLPDWIHNIFADLMGVDRLPPQPTAQWVQALGSLVPGRAAEAAVPSVPAAGQGGAVLPTSRLSRINAAMPAGMPPPAGLPLNPTPATNAQAVTPIMGVRG